MSSIDNAGADGYLAICLWNSVLNAEYAVGGSRVMTVPESMIEPPVLKISRGIGSNVAPHFIAIILMK